MNRTYCFRSAERAETFSGVLLKLSLVHFEEIQILEEASREVAPLRAGGERRWWLRADSDDMRFAELQAQARPRESAWARGLSQRAALASPAE